MGQERTFLLKMNLINEVLHTYVKERITENTITFFGGVGLQINYLNTIPKCSLND